MPIWYIIDSGFIFERTRGFYADQAYPESRSFQACIREHRFSARERIAAYEKTQDMGVIPPIVILVTALLLSVGVMYFFNLIIFYTELC